MTTYRRLFLGILVALIAVALALPTVLAQDPLPQPPVTTEPPGLIEPPCCGVFTNPEWMSIDYHRVSIDVENQIATTTVDMQFTNNGSGFVEGTFLFPLPEEAAVDNLVMYIDGQPIEARILAADEARQIYDEIVRQYRDPALLEYVGRNAIQANVFPIPEGESRRIEFEYTQVLEADNGLFKITYPMETTATRDRAVDSMSLSVSVDSADEVSNIYSPSHDIAINREGDTRFRVGFENSNYTPDSDFVLYYGIENNTVSANLLSYRESATEDGFFMLMVQPPVTIPDEQVIPKDVIIVLDQSGSMDEAGGLKWKQAQSAAAYVLDNLNPEDRFNVVAFSTGWRTFSSDMEPASVADEATDWVMSMFAEGGTDINGALQEAVRLAHSERPTTILFLTDGLATEGVTETPRILQNLDEAAGDNIRVFAFGVGNDVDTLLLDSLARDFRGSSSYVRPTESIDEEVSALYNRVSAPVLTDVTLDTGDIRTDFVYPSGQLPDLFAGEQLTIVGRYREGGDDVTVTLSGEINGDPVTYTYENYTFTERAGGDPFIARLWATRRIGDLLNTIRLNGESDELVDSVVSLSLRYGIITPYTSFLIEEDDILSQQGRARAEDSFRADAETLRSNTTGAAAVDAADDLGGLADASAPMPNAPTIVSTQMAQSGTGGGGTMDNDPVMEAEEEVAAAPGEAERQSAPIVNVGEKSFILQNGVYTDTTFDPDTMETETVVFLSDEYFDLIAEMPQLAEYFAVGDAVIVVVEGTAYEVVPA